MSFRSDSGSKMVKEVNAYGGVYRVILRPRYRARCVMYSRLCGGVVLNVERGRGWC